MGRWQRRAKVEWLLLLLVTARVAGSQAKAAPKHSHAAIAVPGSTEYADCGRKALGKKHSQSGILRQPDGLEGCLGFVP